MAVGAVVRRARPGPLQPRTRSERFAPLWLCRWDSGRSLAPPNGAFVIAPSAASHAQSIPTTLS